MQSKEALGQSKKGITGKLFGLLLKTPKDIDIWIPNELCKHSKSLNIVEDMISLIMNKQEFNPPHNKYNIEGYQDLFHTMEKVISTEGNHVWNWFLSNRILLHKLSQSKVERLIGNPPWQVQNNSDLSEKRNKERQVTVTQIGKIEGVHTTTRSTFQNRDLACVFTARVSHLYLNPEIGKYGWVLPGTALIGEGWTNWRKGNWHGIRVNHYNTWDLNGIEPHVFEQTGDPNGVAVVFGERFSKNPKKIKHELWKGSHETPVVKEYQLIERKPSPKYKGFYAGAIYRPFCYYQVRIIEDIGKGIVSIATEAGQKKPWLEAKSRHAEVESKGLLRLADSKDLVAKSKNTDSVKLNFSNRLWLIAPLDQGKLMKSTPCRTKKYPKLDAFWKECATEYRELKNDSAPDNLEDSHNYSVHLEKQVNHRFEEGVKKVVYNSSGNKLRAIRIPCDVIASSKLYWFICDTEKEAQYLVGVINAPDMQSIWNATKTSLRDYHKRPFQSIPVPKFNPNEVLHNEIANVVDTLEQDSNLPQDLSPLNPLLRKLLKETFSLVEKYEHYRFVW